MQSNLEPRRRGRAEGPVLAGSAGDVANPPPIRASAEGCEAKQRLTLTVQKDPDVARLRDRYLLALASAEGCDGERRKIWEDESRRLRDQLGDLVLAKLGWAGEKSDTTDERAESGYAHPPIAPRDLSDTSAGKPLGCQN